MKEMSGTLIFDFKGRRMEIPYSNVPYGGENRLHLTDKKGCVHIVDFIEGRWKLLWHERYSTCFQDTLDWVIKQELAIK